MSVMMNHIIKVTSLLLSKRVFFEKGISKDMTINMKHIFAFKNIDLKALTN